MIDITGIDKINYVITKEDLEKIKGNKKLEKKLLKITDLYLDLLADLIIMITVDQIKNYT